MKKLLILLSLTTAMTAFGASAEKGPEATNTMYINATVLQPLNVINDGDVNFGNIIQNTTTSKIAKKFTVTGTPGQKVIFKINNQNLDSFSNDKLTKVGGGAEMPLYTDSREVSSGDRSNPTIGQNGTLDFTFNVWTQASQNQAPGQYTGALNASVRYN